MKYDEATWYPNFPDVCKKLDEAIKSLSFQELNELYVAMELGETIINSTHFSNCIFSAMKEKMLRNEYKEIANIELDENRAKFLEKSTVPDIFYHGRNKSLFMSNVLFSFVKKSMEEDEIEKNNDIDEDIKRMVISI